MLARTPALPEQPVERVSVDVFVPVGRLAQGVGHHLDGAELERPVDLLPRGEPPALHVVLLPGQIVERTGGARRTAERRAVCGHGRVVELGVAGVGMFVPGEGVAEERLPQPEVVGPRQPIGVREEVVDAVVGRDAPRTCSRGCVSAPRPWSRPSVRPTRSCSIPRGSSGR